MHVPSNYKAVWYYIQYGLWKRLRKPMPPSTFSDSNFKPINNIQKKCPQTFGMNEIHFSPTFLSYKERKTSLRHLCE